MEKVILGKEARDGLKKGIEIIAKSVITSLGPNGRNTIYEKNGEIMSTKDGVSIAKEIKEIEDSLANMGANLIKQASIKTADKVGDGTTTSTLLAYEIIRRAFAYMDETTNVVELKKGLESVSKDVIRWIENNIKKDISSEEQLQQIATISANNDEEIGTIIAQALDQVGIEGVIHLEESRTGETYLENVEGMQFDRGYQSPYFVTDNNTMSAQLKEPLVLIYDGTIGNHKEMIPLLTHASTEGKPLLIIADDFGQDVLSLFIVNKMRGTVSLCAVKSPDYGDRRKLILEDIAIITGGTVVSKDKGMKLDKLNMAWLGSCKMATIEKGSTTIVDGRGSEEVIAERVEELKNQVNLSTTPYEIEKLNERLAQMSGGISIIHVGGNTETEAREKKDRVEDALFAAKAAYSEGIVPGGGTALLRASLELEEEKDKNIWTRIIYEACKTPFTQILLNAGFTKEHIKDIESSLINNYSNELWTGYNIKTDEYVNMMEAKILDPFKVTKNALLNAVSVASTILLTECVIINEKEENQSGGFDPSMMM